MIMIKTVKVCKRTQNRRFFSLLFSLLILSALPADLSAEIVNNYCVEDDLSKESLATAIQSSLAFFEKEPKNAVVFDKRNVRRRDLKQSLADIHEKLVEFGLTPSFYQHIKDNYDLHDVSGDLRLTGYFEAELNGSFTKDERFKYPIYKVPPDLKEKKLKNGRYYSREAIDFEKVLAGKDLELAWTDDPIKLFFLHIQGSGKLQMPDGEIIDIQYGDNNGHAYKAIAKKLMQERSIKSGKISMQAITQYLKENPQRMRSVFSYNPRYIFFQRVQNGPIGSLGETLTPKRSVALDQKIFPKGALLLLKSEEPTFNEAGDFSGWKPFTRFVLNQDSGIAIKGEKRADYFIGYGEESELIAGHLYRPARLLVVLPKLSPPQDNTCK